MVGQRDIPGLKPCSKKKNTLYYNMSFEYEFYLRLMPILRNFELKKRKQFLVTRFTDKLLQFISFFFFLPIAKHLFRNIKFDKHFIQIVYYFILFYFILTSLDRKSIDTVIHSYELAGYRRK